MEGEKLCLSEVGAAEREEQVQHHECRDFVPVAAGRLSWSRTGALFNHAAQISFHVRRLLMGFWKDVLPTLIMVSNPSIQFMLYKSMVKKLKSQRGRNGQWLKDISATEVFLLGALAKLGATVATYPLLVVKSRLQAKQEIGGDKALAYTGTMDAVVKMIRFEGIAGFYKGMSTKIVQSVFSAAVLFMIKEELVKAARFVVTENGKVKREGNVKPLK